MRTHGPFLSIKCLNKGPWKEGPGPEKIMQRQFPLKNRKSQHVQAKTKIGPFFTRFYLGKMDFGQIFLSIFQNPTTFFVLINT
jgi:hypothetical protein